MTHAERTAAAHAPAEFSRFFIDRQNRVHVMLHDRPELPVPEFTVSVTSDLGGLGVITHYTPRGLRALVAAAQAALAALDACLVEVNLAALEGC